MELYKGKILKYSLLRAVLPQNLLDPAFILKKKCQSGHFFVCFNDVIYF